MVERVVVSKTVSDLIGDQMGVLMPEVSQPSVRRAMQNFGVVLTATYLQSRKGMSPNDVSVLIDEVIGSLVGNEDKIRLVFEASCRYACSQATNQELLFSDWEKKYAKLWRAVKGKHKRYVPSTENIGYVNEFFLRNGVQGLTSGMEVCR
jgi:hypothetical protein